MDVSTADYAEWCRVDDRLSVERFVRSWRVMLEVEGRDVAREHAGRVIGGEHAGHWCNCDDQQREAARRFLAETERAP